MGLQSGCWPEASVPCHMNQPVELLAQHGSLLPQSKKFEREGEGKRRSCSLFYNLICTETYHTSAACHESQTLTWVLWGQGEGKKMWLVGGEGEGDHWVHLGGWLPYYFKPRDREITKDPSPLPSFFPSFLVSFLPLPVFLPAPSW